jgi:hypothetical protein
LIIDNETVLFWLLHKTDIKKHPRSQAGLAEIFFGIGGNVFKRYQLSKMKII